MDSLGKWVFDAAAGDGYLFLPLLSTGPSGSQAEDARPNCRPILFDETPSGFEDPSLRNVQMGGNTMGSQQDEPTGKIPHLNSVSGTGQGIDASPFWRLGKSPRLVQKAVSLFSGKITMQFPFADLFLQDCE